MPLIATSLSCRCRARPGGVCTNRGCILQRAPVAKLIREAEEAEAGISFGAEGRSRKPRGFVQQKIVGKLIAA
jgi:pyruvate/2-oxoglutarate dehydrogenase complex dihydrolipoamide dehydrogenase (E3) component